MFVKDYARTELEKTRERSKPIKKKKKKRIFKTTARIMGVGAVKVVHLVPALCNSSGETKKTKKRM